jgi:hypothetical protein
MLDTTWLTATAHAQLIAVFVANVAFLLNSKSGRKEFLFLGLLLFITLSSEVAGFVGGFIYRKNMNQVYNIVLLFVIPLFLSHYKTKISSQRTIYLVNVGLILFVIFGVIDLFFIQKELSMTMYTRQLGNILMILISIQYFYILIKELPTQSITRLPMFWINAAVLIYYSGTFFQYLTADYLVQVSNINFVNIWTIHNFLGTIYYLMLAYSLWVNRSAVTAS